MPNAIKQLLVAAAVVAISMVFIIQFRPGTNVELEGRAECAVEVAGGCVPYSDYTTAIRLVSPNIEKERLEQLRLREAVIDGLIEQHLLVEDAKRLELAISEEEVSRQIATTGMARFSLPVGRSENLGFILGRYWGGAFLPEPYGPARAIPVMDPKAKAFDYERYQRWVVRRSGKTEKDFKDYQRREAIAARMRDLVRSRVRLSEKEAFDRYAQRNERVVVDYVPLQRAYYRDHVVVLDDEKLASFTESSEDFGEVWEQRKATYTPSCRRARHILIRVDEENPDPEAAKQEAKDKLLAAQARITAGESFADVARDVSQDSSTAKQGGDLGCFAAGKLTHPVTTKKIDDAAQGLDVGAVSAPIETRIGFHLVTVDEVLDGEAAEKHGKRIVAEELYAKTEAERIAAEGAKQMLAAVQGGKSLADALHDHLMAVLPEKAKKAYLAGRGGGEEGDEGGDEDEAGDEPATSPSGFDAWSDPTRPEVKTSDPFPVGGPPFPQTVKPMDAARNLFALEKGKAPGDVVKLVDGYAVPVMKDRQAIDASDEKWLEEKEEFMAQYLRDKQYDALIHYLDRLRSKLEEKPIINVPLAPAGAPSAAPSGAG